MWGTPHMGGHRGMQPQGATRGAGRQEQAAPASCNMQLWGGLCSPCGTLQPRATPPMPSTTPWGHAPCHVAAAGRCSPHCGRSSCQTPWPRPTATSHAPHTPCTTPQSRSTYHTLPCSHVPSSLHSHAPHPLCAPCATPWDCSPCHTALERSLCHVLWLCATSLPCSHMPRSLMCGGVGRARGAGLDPECWGSGA